MDAPESNTGLSTEEALLKLHSQIDSCVTGYNGKRQLSSENHWFHHGNRYVSVHWTSVLIAAFCFVAALTSYIISPEKDGWLLLEACCIALLLLLNIAFAKWDSHMRDKEIQKKISTVLEKIKGCCKPGLWESAHYISLHSPLSPCMSLQWTLRDGVLVNLPCGLLVEGDVMYVRPGQAVPTSCRQIQESDSGDQEAMVLQRNDTYQPKPTDPLQEPQPTMPRAQRTMQAIPFVALETPFLANIKLMLENGTSRPPGLLCNERYSSYSIYVERIIIPMFFVLGLIVNSVRVSLLHYVSHWVDLLLVNQVHIILPLTALIFPIIWRMLEFYGTAKIEAIFESSLHERDQGDDADYESHHVLLTPGSSSVRMSLTLERMRVIVRGDSESLPRTSPLVQTFGSLTDFCCVDKKGILSWPNPTAEKVFFIRENTSRHHNRKVVHDNSIYSMSDSQRKASNLEFLSDDEVLVEVLDLTQNPKNGQGLQFDDPNWARHINSLKPLGLNILLNTCNIDTVEDYTEFADHVTCVAANLETAVPVVNRRCFCELSKAIGFTDQALDLFQSQKVLGLYRPVAGEDPTKDIPPRSRSFTKYLMPMPNMFSVVAKEANSGMSQLFSQGTGDLLLDTCSEFWDGKQLKPLCSSDRRRIADFYHRTSMSSYCTAFAYRPLAHSLALEMENQVIEVPENSRDLFNVSLSPEPVQSWDNSLGTRSPLQPQFKQVYHGSADSLMLGGGHEPVDDVQGCFSTQCNQVFIGMISMQYQAKSDIVQLIEDLDSACIRFIHFSKENELRSRVFSEKMGLEAGWNCHISLANAQPTLGVESRTTSPSAHDLSSVSRGHNASSATLLSEAGEVTGKQSILGGKRRNTAPGAISTNQTQVKFETEIQAISEDTEGNIDSGTHQALTFEVGNSSEVGNTFGEVGNTRVNKDQVQYNANTSAVKFAQHSDSENEDNSDTNINVPLLRDDETDKNTNTVAATVAKETEETQIPLLNNNENNDLITHTNTTKKGLDTDAIVHNTNNHNKVDGDSEGSESGKSNGDNSSSSSSSSSSVSSGSSGKFRPSSYFTGNTDSELEIANRARLPRGIENIRPHLEKVDNVPLLVSLFTDCQPETTTEMMKILQEYGEVLFCFGSTANLENTQIFLQTDAALGVEPLYPQLCQRYPAVRKTWVEKHYTPMQLHAMLNSIPCALTCAREDNLSLVQLIAVARHHCQSMRNTFTLLMHCELYLAGLQLLSSLLLQAPPLGAHHVIWLAWIVAPVISVTMMAAKPNNDVIKQAQGKNLKTLSRHNVRDFVLHTCVRVLPGIVVSVLCHACTLLYLCNLDNSSPSNASLPSNPSLPSNASTSVPGYLGSNTSYVTDSVLDMNTTAIDDVHSQLLTCNYGFKTRKSNGDVWLPEDPGLSLTQNIVAMQVMLQFIFSSMCFVHRKQHLWRKVPCINRVWLICSVIFFVLQVLFFAVHMAVSNSLDAHVHTGDHVPLHAWLVTCLWPVLVVPLHELVKRREIKYAVRYQKRARLDFGTKLGMNSPF